MDEILFIAYSIQKGMNKNKKIDTTHKHSKLKSTQ